MSRSYYRLLGVSQHCSQSELTKAYRMLAFKYHPDRNPDGVEKFKEIARAYEVLSDMDLRHTYDAAGDQVYKNGMPPLFTTFNISRTDLDTLFKYDNNGYNINAAKSPNSVHDLWVTLEDVYCGNKVSAEVQKIFLCDQCAGSGSVQTSETCDTCAGSYRNEEGEPCASCQGSGLQREICTTCEGLKTKTVSKTYTVPIKKGMLEGTEIPFSGEGDKAVGCHPGDRIFKVKYLDHKCYQIENFTKLVVRIDLPLHQAITQVDKVIKLPDQRKLCFRFSLPAGKIIKKKIRKLVKGEGMTDYFNPEKHGKLVLEFLVQFPQTLSEVKQKDLQNVLGRSHTVHSCTNQVSLEELSSEDMQTVSNVTFPNTVFPVLRGKCGCSSNATNNS